MSVSVVMTLPPARAKGAHRVRCGYSVLRKLGCTMIIRAIRLRINRAHNGIGQSKTRPVTFSRIARSGSIPMSVGRK